jgi:hypothetical protein
MNIWSSGSLLSRAGYLSFRPTSTDTSAFLYFGGGSCYDARGVSDLVIELQVSSSVSLKIDFGTSNDCSSKSASDYSGAVNVRANPNYQTVSFPVNFFANMNLQRLLTIGIGNVSPLNVELRIRKIYFTRRAFVTRARHELFEWTSSGTRIPFRFSSFNAPDLIGRSDKGQDGWLDPYEQEDILISAKQMGARVVRTYTLRVKAASDTNGVGSTKAFQGIGTYGEISFVHLDRALQYANRHGIRLIIPFIDNWEFFGGVAAFAAFRGLPRDAFFSDSNLILDFKNAIGYVLNRVNTFTGVRYRDDPAIFAWQLGNELCIGELHNWNAPNYRVTPPSSWATEIANHIRTIDNNHLIMDGFWSNAANGGGNWDTGLLSVRYLDILNVHFYGGESSTSPNNEYSKRMGAIETNAVASGKAVIIDEFGIARRAILQAVQNVIAAANNRIAGILLWSIRSQSVNGGAIVHNEYAGFQSYQWPGYTGGPMCDAFFRVDNYDVVNDMMLAMQSINSGLRLARPSIYPPCSHRGAILQAVAQSSFNNRGASCIWLFRHSIPGVTSNYRAVNLRIRQPTGAYTNMVQFSFDNVKFLNLNTAVMTVTEGNFLYSHGVPAVSGGGSTRLLYYRSAGLLRDNQYTKPTASMSVLVANVDNAFFNWWRSQAASTLADSNAPTC